MGAAAGQLVNSARRYVAVVLPESGEVVSESFLRQLGRAAGQGIDVKLMARETLIKDRDLMNGLDEFLRGVEVRLVGEAIEELVLVDDVAALMRTKDAPVGQQAMVVRAPGLLSNLRALFAASWRSGVAMDDRRKLEHRSRNEVTQRILVALSSGRTDEAAARTLGMSVRTFRRHVAEIARELGSSSRFQTGARAVELGLIPSVVSIGRSDLSGVGENLSRQGEAHAGARLSP
ncbi:DNA-binding response regulator [Streptomyces sp. NPDC093707]|uniref:DNA-binding response regulator n=1 Tax=Streptomyces sp. NPDC093707 TaxID=3154984 RepID=UPI00344D7F47